MPVESDRSGNSTRGSLNYLSGLSAEDAVARTFETSQHEVLERRWRGRSGEVDLILRGRDGLVFVEVKKAETHSAAAERLTPAQIGRIMSAAAEYAEIAAPGSLTPIRIDAALVDGQGRIEVLRNISIL
ncbi:MAG: hypothetical protein HKN98_00925 [Silicimonas sp.]|nr:YraN family protein [Silicimonas sp.]NND17117.1 hypothetical protein [Silicimonas sp.]